MFELLKFDCNYLITFTAAGVKYCVAVVKRLPVLHLRLVYILWSFRITITKTRLCKYTLRILLPRNENFQMKISAQNIDCGYSLEPTRRGGSNEYPKSMLLSRNKKINV